MFSISNLSIDPYVICSKKPFCIFGFSQQIPALEDFLIYLVSSTKLLPTVGCDQNYLKLCHKEENHFFPYLFWLQIKKQFFLELPKIVA